jgi:mRNA-degrading endonuclease RelE of RelBE toxin-antitoxin system
MKKFSDTRLWEILRNPAFAQTGSLDFVAVLDELERNPTMGNEIFPGCRKARIAIHSKGRGKSSGGRVIFYYEVSDERVTLLFIYDKSEMESVQTAYIEQILKKILDER